MKKSIIIRMIQTVLVLFLQGAILFVLAWSFKWIWAWIFISTRVIILIINAIVLPKELIEERGKKKENVKKWDKFLTSIIIIPFLGIYILSGLDFRFHWTPGLGSGIHFIALSLYILGSMIVTWSMLSNNYFSTVVRIQDDRGHSVASQGPYKYVRHPGYISFIIMNLVTPVLLGSLFALTMAFLVCILFIIRTELEDKTLAAELPGYKEYSEQTKYKLVPFVW